MTAWRKTAIVSAVLLLLIGLWILNYDIWFWCCHGFDYNDVASVSQDRWFGEVIIDWPTGERSLFANYPLYLYSIPLVFGGIVILFFGLKPPYRGRIYFGTE